jgi:putative ABC transport system ATP-binding protein
MDLNKEGRTVLIVTHDPEITEYVDRVILVKDGIIEYN